MKTILTFFAIFLNLSLFGQFIHDQSYLDESFWKFKIKLENAILNKDTVQLKPLLANRIFESKDVCGLPGCTKEEFMLYYFRSGSEFAWNEMESIIRFGFKRIIDENPQNIIPHDSLVFQGPSYLNKFNSEKEVLILAENVNVRERPSLKSKILRQASYETLKCDCSIYKSTSSTFQTIEGIDWLEVYLEDNTKGYVAAKYTSYNFIKEMTIAKINGKWKIISFFNPLGC